MIVSLRLGPGGFGQGLRRVVLVLPTQLKVDYYANLSILTLRRTPSMANCCKVHNSFIHSGYLYSAPSINLLRGALIQLRPTRNVFSIRIIKKITIDMNKRYFLIIVKPGMEIG